MVVDCLGSLSDTPVDRATSHKQSDSSNLMVFVSRVLRWRLSNCSKRRAVVFARLRRLKREGER
jgi:hypothetical protein